jgi:hypothetical protein
VVAGVEVRGWWCKTIDNGVHTMAHTRARAHTHTHTHTNTHTHTHTHTHAARAHTHTHTHIPASSRQSAWSLGAWATR